MEAAVISVQKSGANRAMRWASAQTLLLLVVCMFTQCVCQNSREDAPPTAVPEATTSKAPPKEEPKIPTVVDVKDLDIDEKLILAEVLNSQFDPCGEPQSFMAALEAAAPCERALESAAFVVNLVHQIFDLVRLQLFKRFNVLPLHVRQKSGTRRLHHVRD